MYGLLLFLFVVLARAAENADGLTVSVMRSDLRPLPEVAVQVKGAANRDGVTDQKGNVVFEGAGGPVTITPLGSGFRFDPPQFAIANPGSPGVAKFVAIPTATDLAISITSDEVAPLVGTWVNSVVTLQNLGPDAATEVAVSFGSLPGLVTETADATDGRLDFQAYGTVWRLSRINPGASAEVRVRSRATLPGGNVLTVAMVDEMDQKDTDPLNNSAELFTRPIAATARLNLTMAIDQAKAKVGETVPVRLTLRNDGPNDATQVALRTYLPPGATLTIPANGLDNSSIVIPRIAPGGQVELSGAMRVRITGAFTLIANVTSLEQQLPEGVAWPEARANFTVEPAFARVTLFAFSDPPNPRVGDDVNVLYVAKNEGPDAITGLKLFTREDPRLDVALTSDPTPPPLPGPFVFGEVLPAGSYTYLSFRYSVKAAGELTNYFTVQYQDQLIPNAQDHPEFNHVFKTLPSDIGLSLDANPKEITASLGERLTIEFPVHNDGPQPARGLLVNYESPGLVAAELDEVIHADRVERPKVAGYIDVLEAEETVRVRKHFFAAKSGLFTNVAQINTARERPDLLLPIAAETIRLNVLSGPSPDLSIGVEVDRSQVNVGEYAIFIVTVTNRATQPAYNVWVRESDAVDNDFAFETVRGFSPSGDNPYASASDRLIPRIEPGGTCVMSRTMRVRKAVPITYVAKITGVNGVYEPDLPSWVATTETMGVQVECDIGLSAFADRTNVKNGDLVTFVVVERNLSSRTVSHVGSFGGPGAGFQMLYNDLASYGYFYDWARPRDLESGALALSEWTELAPEIGGYTYFPAYTVGSGEFTMKAQLSQLDQNESNPANNVAQVQVQSAPASARISIRHWPVSATATLGYVVPFVTEIRNDGPDRVTGLTLAETVSENLELTYDPAVIGLSGNVVTSFNDSLFRLPPLEPGQNFVWQRTFSGRKAGNAWRRVRVTGFDQTALETLPESEATVTIQPAQADLALEFLQVPVTAQNSIPAPVTVRVRNLGPSVATGVKVAVLTEDALRLGIFEYGPRASIDLLGWNTFQTQLLPGESAIVSFDFTPTREGSGEAVVRVEKCDQADPNLANNILSLTLDIAAAPPIPEILRVRKVRRDFFDGTPISEIEVDQGALSRLAPLGVFSLEATSNLQDWEFLGHVGLLSLGRATFTDHAPLGTRGRMYRLR